MLHFHYKILRRHADSLPTELSGKPLGDTQGCKGLLGWASGKGPACQCRRHERLGFDPWVGKEDPLEEGMATHSSIFAWRIPWTEKPGRLVHGVAESDVTEST